MPRVSVNGADLYVEERGSGPPILLIHGLAADADVWGGSLDELAQDHRVLAYDRRGYTRSGQVALSDFRRDGEDAAALLRALDAAPATVVGWSSGGIVALDLAVHHPDLVAGLVLLEPTLHAKKRPGARHLAAFLKASLLRRVKDDRDATEAFLRWAFRHRTGGTWYDRLPTPTRDALLANGSAAMSELDIGTGEHLKDDQIAAIACPAVVLVGELSDPMFRRVSERTARLLPRGRIERVPGAGHVIHLERPAEFVRAVREASQPPRSRSGGG
jgi:pimeloyl-ACP methyl ester carboxylesterase